MSRSFKRQVAETDLPTKVYRTATGFMMTLIIAGGAWFLNDLSGAVKDLSRDINAVKIDVGRITYIQQEQSKRFDSLERKVERLQK